ncbi:hypothetical protein BDF21DRAFT_398922 [Thamnidium elegans]|nr:hypothetical protein BDF21DRAFT_398922 [Thamnidium elegans]
MDCSDIQVDPDIVQESAAMDTVSMESDVTESAVKESAVKIAVASEVSNAEVVPTESVAKESSCSEAVISDTIVQESRSSAASEAIRVTKKKPTPVPILIPPQGIHATFRFQPPSSKPHPIPKVTTPTLFTKPVRMIDNITVTTFQGDSYDVQRRTSFWEGGNVRPDNPNSVKHIKPDLEPSGRTKKCRIEHTGSHRANP